VHLIKLTALAVAGALSIAVPSFASESAADFQFYVLGDLNLQGQNVPGRIAVGGDATFASTSIGGASSEHPASLVVGDDLTYKNGGSIAGQALVGGDSTAPAYLPITDGVAALPLDFTAENLRLKNLSATLAAMSANGAAELKWGGLFLTGLDSGLNVFSIDSSMLSNASWFSTNIAQGSQVLINVTGDNARMSGGLNFYTPSNVLWNFTGSSLTAGGVSIGGSILAPNASFQGNGGSIAGNLIVGNFNGAMSFGNSGYSGGFLTPPPIVAPAPPADGPVTGPVPEPGAWALMILGLGFVGAVLRRRRGQRQTAAVA
jgi:choice-of-anchor A domain-containing protein